MKRLIEKGLMFGNLTEVSSPALVERKIEACIPSKSNRKIQIPHDRVLYRKRHKIENMFGKLKDWRRIHTLTTAAPTPSCPQSP